MTEVNAHLERELFYPQPQRDLKPSSRWKKAMLAGLFSLVIAGMGQLYNRQPRKALGLALTLPVYEIFVAHTGIIFSFFAMLAFFAVLLGWRLLIAAEAAYSAWAAKKPEPAIWRPRTTYTLFALGLLVAALYPTTQQFKRWASVGAFTVSSVSMCPTICPGERIIADMGAYKTRSPQRGDLVLLEHKPFPSLWMKRVIGIAGDVVAPGPGGAILVNGKPLVVPGVCGSPIQQKEEPSDYSAFKSTKVTQGMFFVVGDNLGYSFDSRLPEFGPVFLDQVRGRPEYIYWSPSRSRIGCATR